jgi:hypothetical protein
LTGYFTNDTDFDPGAGTDMHYAVATYDAYLVKYDASSNFEWARTWGGTDWDRGFGLAVDDTGAVYVVGEFIDTVDFDPGPGVDEHTTNGLFDAFLSKFSSAGDLVWAYTWGGEGDVWDYGRDVAFDSSGYLYVTGSFGSGADFDFGPGAYELLAYGKWDAFLSKIAPDGTLQWARSWGGGDIDEGLEMVLDSTGNIYVVGGFAGTADFNPGPGYRRRSPGAWNSDVFLNKIGPDGMW